MDSNRKIMESRIYHISMLNIKIKIPQQINK